MKGIGHKIGIVVFAALGLALLFGTSSAAAVTMTVEDAAAGAVRYFPEMGLLDLSPTGEYIASTYFRTTATNRCFRRGFVEFAVPGDIGAVSSATLTLIEWRAVITNPVPPDLHELSSYPADLVIDTNDFDRPTTPVTTFETDANLPPQVFELDVTDAVAASVGQNLGFRIKLAGDPAFDFYGSTGTGFNDWQPVVLEIVSQSDATPPEVFIDSPEHLVSYAADSGETFSFWATDADSGVASVVGEYEGGVVESGDPLPTEPGVYTFTATATDNAGNTSSESVMFVVYDPSAGFVTGGGWIGSPAGAYYDDPTVVDKATFAFVSRYKKGATVPDGMTQFQFHGACLDFHSNTQQWLVVNQAGENAQFKCTGTVNGQFAPGSEPFDCMIWAGDHDDGDTFRIKIFYQDGEGFEHVVYDNGAHQLIDGGSIVVHTKK